MNTILLSIAKAKLDAELRRNGLTKANIDHLLEEVNAAARRGSRENVQRCKRAVLITFKDTSVDTFAAYLTQLSSMGSSRRARNILYIIHDIVCQQPGCASGFQSGLPRICYAAREYPSSCQTVIDIWKRRKVYEEPFLENLRLLRKPVVLPVWHGQQGASFDRLPAACMLPYIKGDYTPIPSQELHPLKLPGEISEELLRAMDEFYKHINTDWKFAESGEKEMSYYGWSEEFCNQRDIGWKRTY